MTFQTPLHTLTYIIMSPPSNPLNAYQAWPFDDDDQPVEGAFDLNTSSGIDQAVVTGVRRPWVFGFKPTSPTSGNRRAVLILGGGGYVELMVGREGVQVAKWLAGLGFYAFVLIHRFPNHDTGSRAPVDDARQALKQIEIAGFGRDGLGVCGLSSGGHLAASLMSEYPSTWYNHELPRAVGIPNLDFAIIGYAPISTNAKGRQIIPDKPNLEPPEKQGLYDIMQPDVHLKKPVPPTFIVYAGNDPVVPVPNAYRLAEGISKAGAAVELHVFADAPHGFALDTPGLPVSEWTGMCEKWLGQGGLLG
jgi:acetyl esterase/lipase